MAQGPPLADVARTCLLIEHGSPSQNGNAVQGTRLESVRHRFLEAYLARYEELRPFEPSDLAIWELPTAAARLEEGISIEEESLLKMVEARLKIRQN